MLLDFDKKELVILCSALDCYMNEMERRKRQTDYLFEGYSIEKRKQLAEENRVLLAARIDLVNRISAMLHVAILDA